MKTPAELRLKSGRALSSFAAKGIDIQRLPSKASVGAAGILVQRGQRLESVAVF